MPGDAALIWNRILSIVGATFVWWVKGISSQLTDVRGRLSETREEMAKEYATKEDMHQDCMEIISRFDRLEENVDRVLSARA